MKGKNEKKEYCGICYFVAGTPFPFRCKCKKHAPGMDSRHSNMDGIISSQWPTVDYDDWCGDYKRKENDNG